MILVAATQPEASRVSPTPVAQTQPGNTSLNNFADGVRNLIEAGKADQALQNLGEAKNKMQEVDFYFLHGRIMQELKRNTEALASYSVALYIRSNHIGALINKALTRGALGDISGALDDLNNAAKIDPDNPVIPMNRGVTLAGLNKPKEALKEFDRALEIDRRYAHAYRNRGITRFFLKDITGACRDWRQATSYGDVDTLDWTKFYCSKNQSSSKNNTNKEALR